MLALLIFFAIVGILCAIPYWRDAGTEKEIEDIEKNARVTAYGSRILSSEDQSRIRELRNTLAERKSKRNALNKGASYAALGYTAYKLHEWDKEAQNIGQHDIHKKE